MQVATFGGTSSSFCAGESHDAACKGTSMSGIQNSSIHVRRQSDAYWRVTFDIPPLNIFGPANIPQLERVVSSVETDDRVKVVVFDSAVDGFFLTHYNFLAEPEESAKFPPGRTGLQPLPDTLVRISRGPVVSIALIRGRGNRCQQRTRSRQRYALCQPGKGGALTMGGRCRLGSRWRTHGSTPSPHWPSARLGYPNQELARNGAIKGGERACCVSCDSCF